MQSRHSKLASTIITICVILSAVIFFQFPTLQWVAKLGCIATLAGFGVWHYFQRQIRGIISCAVGVICMMFFLPNTNHSHPVELLILGIASIAASILLRRKKPSTDETDEYST